MSSSSDHHLAKSIFLKVSSISDPALRLDYLHDLCGDNDELRKEVQSLLEFDSPETIVTPLQFEDQPMINLNGDSNESRQRWFTPDHRTLSRSQVPRLARLAFVANRRVLLIASLVLIAVVWISHRTRLVATDMVRSNIDNTLRTILRSSVNTIDAWLTHEISTIEMWAHEQSIVDSAASLQSIALNQDSEDANILRNADQQIALLQLLRRIGRSEVARFPREFQSSSIGTLQSRPPVNEDGQKSVVLITNREGRILSCTREELIGSFAHEQGMRAISRNFAGESVVSLPMIPSLDFGFGDRPMVFFSTPIMGSQIAADADQSSARNTVQATLHLGLDANPIFSRLLHLGQIGETGETYAFDRDGIMLTESRFHDSIESLDIRINADRLSEVQNLRIADPGVNLLTEPLPSTQPSAWPLTLMARMASELATLMQQQEVHAFDDVTRHHFPVSNTEGYRDYRGVLVAGRWFWLEKYQFGIATEMDMTSALAPLRTLDRAFVALFVVIGLLSIGFFLSTAMSLLQKQRVDESTRLGQYTLRAKLGEGGLGVVYLGEHALLKRPVAIKTLKTDQQSKQAISRFQREVQMTSLLQHPNTIQVFDYGRTPWGAFYYVMECLDGITLDDLVQLAGGPIRPERTIAIMQDACASLHEAHQRGVIHRDIKPGNIMICHYAATYDYVKVLDFGLAKDVTGDFASYLGNQHTTTSVINEISGTPHFIAPERITKSGPFDARVDTYAVGATLFYLLTARHPFNARTPLEICMHVVQEDAPRASTLSPFVLPRQLDDLIADCLAREPDDRPASVQVVLDRLASIELLDPWSPQEAQSWWIKKQEEIQELHMKQRQSVGLSAIPQGTDQTVDTSKDAVTTKFTRQS